MSQGSEPGRREDDVRPSRPGIIERLRHAFGLQTPSIREELEEALDDEDRSDDDLSPQERAILRNVLTLHEHRVRDIMVPRADIIAVGIAANLSDVLTVFRTAAHSRLPVHGDTLDDPRGMVHIRDLVDYLAGRAEDEVRQTVAADRAPRLPAGSLDLSVSLAAAGIVRPVLFIPPSMPALDLLVRMQATRTHMALVIDEYGGTDGLVSIEDVVEMVVGDIEDEHDEAEPAPVVQFAPGIFILDGRAPLQEVEEETGWPLPQDEDSDIDTIGGLVASLAGRVPARGEIVSDPRAGLEFEILDADPRRVRSVRLRRVDPVPDHARAPVEVPSSPEA